MSKGRTTQIKTPKQSAQEDMVLERRLFDQRQMDIWQEFNDKLEAKTKGSTTDFIKFSVRGYDVLERVYGGSQFSKLDPLRDMIRDLLMFTRRLLRRHAITFCVHKAYAQYHGNSGNGCGQIA